MRFNRLFLPDLLDRLQRPVLRFRHIFQRKRDGPEHQPSKDPESDSRASILPKGLRGKATVYDTAWYYVKEAKKEGHLVVAVVQLASFTFSTVVLIFRANNGWY